MKARLTAAATALALALTSLTAAPAAALSDREKAALGLIIGAVGVGMILDSSRDKPRYREPEPRHDNGRHRGWQVERGIPAACITNVRVDGRRRDVVGAGCAQNAGLRRLPGSCAMDVRTDRGYRTVYGLRCLKDKGYVVGRY